MYVRYSNLNIWKKFITKLWTSRFLHTDFIYGGFIAAVIDGHHSTLKIYYQLFSFGFCFIPSPFSNFPNNFPFVTKALMYFFDSYPTTHPWGVSRCGAKVGTLPLHIVEINKNGSLIFAVVWQTYKVYL